MYGRSRSGPSPGCIASTSVTRRYLFGLAAPLLAQFPSHGRSPAPLPAQSGQCESFTGDGVWNSLTLAKTPLSYPLVTRGRLVMHDKALCPNDADYEWSGTTITFGLPVEAGDTVVVYYKP